VTVQASRSSDDNPFIVNKPQRRSDGSKKPQELPDNWPSDWPSGEVSEVDVPQVRQKGAKAASLAKQQPKQKQTQPLYKPIVTRLLVGMMIALFIVQWWPYLTQHAATQNPFVTSAKLSRAPLPSSTLGALRTLTLSIPAKEHWPNLVQMWMRDAASVNAGQWWRNYTSSLLHVNLLHLLANCLAIHEYGKDLEAHIGHVSFLAVAAVSALASSSLAGMLGAQQGNVAAMPVGASGVVTGIAAALAVLTLAWKEMRGQGLLESSLAAIAAALIVGRLVPGLNNMVHLGGAVALKKFKSTRTQNA
jgi:membrane associated rhomboid family serine protease